MEAVGPIFLLLLLLVLIAYAIGFTLKYVCPIIFLLLLAGVIIALVLVASEHKRE